jgi:hypothetical protein
MDASDRRKSVADSRDDDSAGSDGSVREGRKIPGASRLGEWPVVPSGEGGYRAEAPEVDAGDEGR